MTRTMPVQRFAGARRALLVAAGVAVALLPWPHPARAQSSVPRVAIWVEGPDAERARAELEPALGSDYERVDPGEWHDAFERLGGGDADARALAQPKKRRLLLDRARQACEAAHIDAVVLVATARSRHGHRTADVYVVDATSTTPRAAHAGFGGPKSGLGRAVHEKLAGVHAASATLPATVAPAVVAPSAPAPSPAAAAVTLSSVPAPSAAPESIAPISNPASDRRPSSSTSTVHVAGRELFEVSAGGEVGMRHFAYTDGVTGNLRDYRLGGAPLLDLGAGVYPFADERFPLLSDLGVVLRYAQAVALQSGSSDAGSVATQWVRWEAGGKYRLRTGRGAAPIVGLSAAYGSESFTFDVPPTNATFPSVAYRFVRAGVDARVPLHRFAILGGGSYMDVLSAGDVASRFPHASVAGVEANLGGVFSWGAGLETRLTASYRRFFYAMNPVPRDGYVAGGALDELASAELTLAYVY